MGDFSATVPTVLAGDVPTGDDWGTITSELTAAAAAWTSYTPTWTASAGSVAIGNGTLAGWYNRIGQSVDFRIELTAGSTTTYGTAGAYWNFTIPIGSVSGRFAGPAFAVDTAVLEYPMIWVVGYDSATLVSLFKPGSGRFVNNSPFTFGSTDRLTINGRYESL